MPSQLLKLSDLQEWTGYKRQTDIIEFLKKSKIEFTFGKNGKICTTIAAVDRGIIDNQPNNQEVSF